MARRMQEVIVASCLGVLLGWPVAGVAFLPYILWVLRAPRLGRSFAILLATAVPITAVMVAVDVHFYGRATVRLPGFFLTSCI